MSLVAYLHRVANRENLSPDEAFAAMLTILEGHATTAQIAAFLVALRMKGETSGEILGFARAMRAMANVVDVGLQGETLLDTCGTGGDGGGTFNVSTVTAFVVAGAGVRVAKHGNRSLSSQCGSADVLEELGVDIAMTPERAAEAIREVGIGFLFAPAIHPAMRHAQPARAELKMRTAFNLLGPLTNPAGATAQLIGAPSEEAAELMANALAGLGVERAMVVHGSDGLDEITTTGPTLVFTVTGSTVARSVVRPEDFGAPVAKGEDLRGGDKKRNAAIAMEVLLGEKGPKRDIVLVNAAAALVVGGKAGDWGGGMRLAEGSIESGEALMRLRRLARLHS
ncbi:MAG: anthranilate phosphoribosyltransferase [Acidobacteria bacterium]|nr:anthranilate phosphoribosyltransferase [Acidobacteriota bacterium]